MRGTIIRKREEGYGFIKPENGDKDVFFHASAMQDPSFDEIAENDIVTFDLEEGPKGPAAANVVKVGEVAAEPAADVDAAPVAEETPATEDVAPEGEAEAPAA